MEKYKRPYMKFKKLYYLLITDLKFVPYEENNF